jgi:putative flippase GtrA
MIAQLKSVWVKASRNMTMLRFGAVGLLTTVLDVVFFSVLVHWFALATALSNIVSYGCMVVLSFTLNRYWTFGQNRLRSSVIGEAAKFGVVHLIAVALSTCIVWLLAHVCPATSAKILSVPIVVVWNYLAARFWVFGMGRTVRVGPGVKHET